MTLEELAREVIQGRWGNGNSRKSALEANGYDYSTVQNIVNQMVGGYYDGSANYEYGGSSGSSYEEEPFESQLPSIDAQISARQQKLTSLGDKPVYNSKHQGNIDNYTKQYTAMGDWVDPYAKQQKQWNDYLDNLGDWVDPYANETAEVRNSLKNDTYFNADTDDTFQQYKKDYTREGARAMEDTLGKIASRTGGIASSYASTAAAQTYANYMKELASKIPELKNAAYNRTKDSLNTLLGLSTKSKNEYNDKRTNALNNLSRYQKLSDRDYTNYTNKRNKLKENIDAEKALESADYQKYTDSLSDWYKNRSVEKDALDMLLSQRASVAAQEEAQQAARAAARASVSGGGNNGNNDGGGGGSSNIGNMESNGSYYVDGYGYLSPSQLEDLVDSGQIQERYYDDTNTYYYLPINQSTGWHEAQDYDNDPRFSNSSWASAARNTVSEAIRRALGL